MRMPRSRTGQSGYFLIEKLLPYYEINSIAFFPEMRAPSISKTLNIIFLELIPNWQERCFTDANA
jgi:hypothetical protein